jgi:flagellar biosynthesis chaperone FliJ
MPEPERQRFISLLEEWIEANSTKLEVKKIEISELSEIYSKRLANANVS